jgi:hypothetical protein
VKRAAARESTAARKKALRRHRPGPGGTRIVPTRRGVRIVDGRDVLSDVLSRPGPTHGLFDVLAACIATFTDAPPERAPRVAMLGFAAGGVVAPLRALGFTAPLVAVDLSREAEPIFREMCGEWAGEVRLVKGEASSWLRRQRGEWDFLLEDLTVPHPGGAVKPPVSLEALPELMSERLAPQGVVATNTLPVPQMSLEALLEHLAAPYRRALVVECEDYENRILLAGPGLPIARRATTRLRAALHRIGSRQERRFEMTQLD